MFKLFGSNNQPPLHPLTEEKRLATEKSFDWLVNTFGEEAIQKRRVLIPHHSDFPIRYTGTSQDAYETLPFVARQMEIPIEEIELNIYTETVSELDAGSPDGRKIYLSNDDSFKYTGGLYHGRQPDGKFHISLEKKKLRFPEKIVATLAHELAHIKLLGEERLEENDEPLTDLTTVIFGLGIFNANAAFMTFSNFRSYGWSKSGYLSQMEWGHALALFAHLRGEEKPDWITHLTKNVKGDFLKSYRFLANQGSLR